MMTGTANDIRTALQKRLSTQAHQLSATQLDTLTIDVMNVINTDIANAGTDATTELSKNPVRPFLRHV